MIKSRIFQPVSHKSHIYRVTYLRIAHLFTFTADRRRISFSLVISSPYPLRACASNCPARIPKFIAGGEILFCGLARAKWVRKYAIIEYNVQSDTLRTDVTRSVTETYIFIHRCPGRSRPRRNNPLLYRLLSESKRDGTVRRATATNRNVSSSARVHYSFLFISFSPPVFPV